MILLVFIMGGANAFSQDTKKITILFQIDLDGLPCKGSKVMRQFEFKMQSLFRNYTIVKANRDHCDNRIEAPFTKGTFKLICSANGYESAELPFEINDTTPSTLSLPAIVLKKKSK